MTTYCPATGGWIYIFRFACPQVGQEIFAVPLATGPFPPFTRIGSVDVIDKDEVLGTFSVSVFEGVSKVQVNRPVQE